MEEKKTDLIKKISTILVICGVVLCIAFFFNQLQHESDPYVFFHEVPLNTTINHTVIHLSDQDLFNQSGWKINQNNEKITSIYFGDPKNRDQEYYDFLEKYWPNYLEYNGIYYRISGARP